MIGNDQSHGDDQSQVVLTAHPLQRIGAYALARLGGVNHPDQITLEAFEVAAKRLTEDAVYAALVRDTKKADGFWLKSSLSLFPNAPMNHPSNGKKEDQTIRDAVMRWRRMPDRGAWPSVGCVLCGRDAVGFFGKVDVPLAESDIYRNTTPRGHEGMALCWPCVCCFYALPYGCFLTGGPAIAVHAWDENFLLRTVAQRVSGNGRVMAAGQNTVRQVAAREVVALRALQGYEDQLTSGVDLLVFSNNNRGQTLDVHTMDQPVAEWLRKSMRLPERRRGFKALTRAHRTGKSLGVVGLARNAFRAPDRIVGVCASYLAYPVTEYGQLSRHTESLATLTFSYVKEVMAMDETDLKEITATAGRVAVLLGRAESGGELRKFSSYLKNQKRLRGWFQTQAVQWAVDPPEGESGPLVTTYGFELLFDPGLDSRAWFHRQLLLISVLEELHRRGWQPADGKQVAADLRDEADDLDRQEDEQLTDEGEPQ